jgi:hypothetical protein
VGLHLNRIPLTQLSVLVPKPGLEPGQAFAHMVLSHARMPIPPLRHDRDVEKVRRLYLKHKPPYKILPAHHLAGVHQHGAHYSSAVDLVAASLVGLFEHPGKIL